MSREQGTVWRFALVGLLTAGLFYALVTAGVEWLSLSPAVASAVAYTLVLGFNYLAHYRWTYGSDRPTGSAVSRYGVMVGAGFLMNLAVMHLGTQVLNFNYLLVQTLSMAVVISTNFVLASLWVFRD